MYDIEKFKPVVHYEKFKQMYDAAINKLCDEIGNYSEHKVQAIDFHKESCVFDKTILIYKRKDEIIGFCMYVSVDEYNVFIVLDYVSNKFLGAGRSCREKVFYYFKDKCAELKFVIHAKNHLSKNSIKRLEQLDYLKEDGAYLEVLNDDGFSDKIEYTVIY